MLAKALEREDAVKRLKTDKTPLSSGLTHKNPQTIVDLMVREDSPFHNLVPTMAHVDKLEALNA